MDTIKLQAFIELAETGNFSKAADRLFISQPALSKQIQCLEKELGVPLFNRSGKQSYLTIYGEYFLPYAEKILAQTINAKEHIRQIGNLEGGILKFGATNFIGVYLMPQVLANFKRCFPKINISMTINSSKNLLNLLHRNQLEFILLSDYIKIDEEQYYREFILEDELMLIVGNQSEFFNRTSVDVSELSNQTFITKNQSSSIYKYLNEILTPRGLTLDNCLFISHQEAIKHSVMNNIGISIMSSKAVELEIKQGLINAVKINDCPLTRSIEIVREKNRHITPAGMEFIKMLTA